ncbi:hypothetical protein EON64_06375, partial [archaeon]
MDPVQERSDQALRDSVTFDSVKPSIAKRTSWGKESCGSCVENGCQHKCRISNKKDHRSMNGVP